MNSQTKDIKSPVTDPTRQSGTGQGTWGKTSTLNTWADEEHVETIWVEQTIAKVRKHIRTESCLKSKKR